jgi:hypothetical protein
MDQPLTPSRRLHAQQTYGRAADAFDTVAWRPPTARRFDGRVANDRDGATSPDPGVSGLVGGLPAWVTIAAGGVIAAFMGALLGGALHI